MQNFLNDIKSYCREGTHFQYYRPGMVDTGAFSSDRNATRLFNGVERTADEICKWYDYYVRLEFPASFTAHAKCRESDIKYYVLLSYQNSCHINGIQQYDHATYLFFESMDDWVKFYLKYSDVVTEKGEI